MARRKRKKNYLRTVGVVTMLILIVFMINTVITTTYRIFSLTIQVERNQKVLDEQQKLNQELSSQIERLSSPEYLATFARGEFFLSQGDEQIFILPQPEE